jgi:hypothetical protein
MEEVMSSIASTHRFKNTVILSEAKDPVDLHGDHRTPLLTSHLCPALALQVRLRRSYLAPLDTPLTSHIPFSKFVIRHSSF